MRPVPALLAASLLIGGLAACGNTTVTAPQPTPTESLLGLAQVCPQVDTILNDVPPKPSPAEVRAAQVDVTYVRNQADPALGDVLGEVSDSLGAIADAAEKGGDLGLAVTSFQAASDALIRLCETSGYPMPHATPTKAAAPGKSGSPTAPSTPKP